MTLARVKTALPRRLPSWSLAVVLVLFGLTFVLFQPVARSCSIQVVEFEEVLNLLRGEPSEDWVGSEVVGVVEITVFRVWPETATHGTASAAAPRRIWGDGPSPEVTYNGGHQKAPSTTTSCGSDGARTPGSSWYQVVFASSAGRPLRGITLYDGGVQVRSIDGNDMAILAEAFGSPRLVDTPVVPDTHPSEPMAPTASTVPSNVDVDAAPEGGPSSRGMPAWVAALLVIGATGMAALPLLMSRRDGRGRPS